MNEKEEQILKLIKENPFISQNDLAGKMDISRSAIAGYISSLTKEGKLLGRAYVLPEDNKILCIGGANMDRKSTLSHPFHLGTSNPVSTEATLGGVARNVAENLGRIGSNVHLLSVVGDDREGKEIISRTSQYVGMIPSGEIPGQTTGTYTAILDDKGSMAVAFADMNIYNHVDIDFIENRWSHIASSSLVLLDTNFPPDIIHYILTRCQTENIPVIIVTVSIPKLKNLPLVLKGVKWIILNREEAEVLSGMELKDESDLANAAGIILSKGVEKVVITRGEKGLYYATNSGEEGCIEGISRNVVDVTGAGDSLAAGIIYGDSESYSTREACEFGMSCAAMTIQSKETVSPFLSAGSLHKTKDKLFNQKKEC